VALTANGKDFAVRELEPREPMQAARNAERAAAQYGSSKSCRGLRLRPANGKPIQSEHATACPTSDPSCEAVRDAIDSLSESESAALGSLSGSTFPVRPLTEFDGLLRDTIAVLEIAAWKRSCAKPLMPAQTLRRSHRSSIQRLHEVEQRLEAVPQRGAQVSRYLRGDFPRFLASLRVRLKDRK